MPIFNRNAKKEAKEEMEMKLEEELELEAEKNKSPFEQLDPVYGGKTWSEDPAAFLPLFEELFSERCIACNRPLKLPGLHMEGKGPYGPTCAKKVRRKQAKNL